MSNTTAIVRVPKCVVQSTRREMQNRESESERERERMLLRSDDADELIPYHRPSLHAL